MSSSPTREGQRTPEEIHALLVSKLSTVIDSFDMPAWFVNLSKCGMTQGVMECEGCSEMKELRYQCSQKWCPRCNWKITAKRQKILKLWATGIRNPMHLILTQRNFRNLDGNKLREHTKNLTRIRRHKLMSKVKGGCISVEMTNEARGWHLHSHWLVDAQFVSMEELSKAWGTLTGQEFGIVKYSKLDEKDYVNEVCKYVCKPSAMLEWTALELLQFIETCQRRRFFFVFGNLFHQSKGLREFIKAATAREGCKCKACESTELKVRLSHTAKEYAHRQARKLCLMWE